MLLCASFRKRKFSVKFMPDLCSSLLLTLHRCEFLLFVRFSAVYLEVKEE